MGTANSVADRARSCCYRPSVPRTVPRRPPRREGWSGLSGAGGGLLGEVVDVLLVGAEDGFAVGWAVGLTGR